jgi:hypothetical protein
MFKNMSIPSTSFRTGYETNKPSDFSQDDNGEVDTREGLYEAE